MSRRDTVAVLGCGPAGLLAVHALAMAEQPFALFSRPEKSVIGGAQFLHEPIPGVTDPEPAAHVLIHAEGTPEGYREKVYGKDPAGWPDFVSFPQEDRLQPAWPMQESYDKLWDTYGRFINPVDISPMWLDEALDDFKFVVCAIPLRAVCQTATGGRAGPCVFRSTSIQIVAGNQNHLSDPTIMYNGTDTSAWARASHLFGHSFAEYGPHMPTPPGHSAVKIHKPISNTCTCWDQRNLLRVGRLGAWEKGRLVHDGFTRTMEAIVQ